MAGVEAWVELMEQMVYAAAREVKVEESKVVDVPVEVNPGMRMELEGGGVAAVEVSMKVAQEASMVGKQTH